jgi:beta-phosphoglucomutase family hydrolase
MSKNPDTGPPNHAVLTVQDFEAAAFDLDGVVTATAQVHAAAWTEMFDAFLRTRQFGKDEDCKPFTPKDYLTYIDGRPRLDAIRSFLAHRRITLPEGAPTDSPAEETVHGLAARKNKLFIDRIHRDGVAIYPSTVALARRLRSIGLKTAVVSASRNCEEILRVARLEGLFDAAVTGVDIEQLSLRGKPAPDSFLAAARRLDVPPARTMVFEDAVAGIAAARAGNFGIAIGIDRNGNAAALRDQGADIVVPDLAQLELQVGDELTGRSAWGAPKPDVHFLDPFIAEPGVQTRSLATPARDSWVLAYDNYDPVVEGRREALFSLGNGYFVTRGAAAEAEADDVHYPGTYVAGAYNRLTSRIDGQSIEHEDLVNLPNWLHFSIRIDDGDWIDLSRVEVLAFHQELDFRTGLYQRTMRVRDEHGRETRLQERRFVHMQEKNLAGQHIRVTPENWFGRLTARAMLDGKIENAGVPRYAKFRGDHFRVQRSVAVDPQTLLLEGETTQSKLRVCQAARLRATLSGSGEDIESSAVEEPARIGQCFSCDVAAGASLEVEKIVALYTSLDRAIADCSSAALEKVAEALSFDNMLESHVLAWEHLWRHCDMELLEASSDSQHNTLLAVRLHIFHLLQTASPHTIDLDAGVPARGWHGEGYRGHIFWDELFIFPFLNLRLPTLSRALLLYRYRRLPEARSAALKAGCRGAMFPWQSGSNGREETDIMYFNPRAGSWMKDNTHLERHVGAAVAYNVWQYYQATGDAEFLYSYGAELMIEIARFWASKAEWNQSRERYDIRGVIGPDEFHDRYPDREAPGIDNNAYTNLMAAWCIGRALDLFDILPDQRCQELCERLRVERDEVVHWDNVSRRTYVPFQSDGMISQFEGYDALEEFDWKAYRHKYGSIRRLDLILNAEGLTTNRYKLSKQADVLMLFYLFSAEELADLFERLGYDFDPESIPKTIDYYLRRTSHGSTLSGIIHTWVLARSSRRRSWSLFGEAVESDIQDVQGGTTREGIHLGAMAGTVDVLQRCYAGLELRDGKLHFHPMLPDELKQLSFAVRHRKHSLRVYLTHSALTVTSESSDVDAITIAFDHRQLSLKPGEQVTLPLPLGQARKAK